MSFRPGNEIESSFDQAAQTLDLMLEKARPQLELDQILVHDESNRSGFEKSGVPYYLWQYRFEKRIPYRSETTLALVHLYYLEPPVLHEAPIVRAKWTAEIFQPGQASWFKESGEQVVPFGELKATGIGRLVCGLIDHAEAVLREQRT